jgi:hypothetical protein
VLPVRAARLLVLLLLLQWVACTPAPLLDARCIAICNSMYTTAQQGGKDSFRVQTTTDMACHLLLTPLQISAYTLGGSHGRVHFQLLIGQQWKSTGQAVATALATA